MSKTGIEGEYHSFDKEKIFYKFWLAKNEKAVIQIAHGLGETTDFYEEFARVANANCISVYMNDARGHGKTKADYQNENVINQYAKDLVQLYILIKLTHLNTPVYILGNSLGTVVAQTALLQYPGAWEGIILAGLPFHENIEELISEIKSEIASFGLHAKSVTTYEKLFGRVNGGFRKKEGPLAWLTSDPEVRRQILERPTTNVSYPNFFYRDFLEKAREVQEQGIAALGNKKFPIYILSGDLDVISQNGEYGKRKEKQLKELGFSNVKRTTYNGYRHSIFQESGRSQVYIDVLEWTLRLCDNIIAFDNTKNLAKGKEFVMEKNLYSCRCYGNASQ